MYTNTGEKAYIYSEAGHNIAILMAYNSNSELSISLVFINSYIQGSWNNHNCSFLAANIDSSILLVNSTYLNGTVENSSSTEGVIAQVT